MRYCDARSQEDWLTVSGHRHLSDSLTLTQIYGARLTGRRQNANCRGTRTERHHLHERRAVSGTE
jgi:hypothetical protein